MPHRLIKFTDVDVSMITLNATSVGSLAMSYMTDNLTGFGGFVLIISIAALNFSKAYVNFKKTKNQEK
jgi:hypothetical protein